MSLIMTKEEREAFLADVHVGIISICDEGRGPLTVPIWYASRHSRAFKVFRRTKFALQWPVLPMNGSHFSRLTAH